MHFRDNSAYAIWRDEKVDAQPDAQRAHSYAIDLSS